MDDIGFQNVSFRTEGFQSPHSSSSKKSRKLILLVLSLILLGVLGFGAFKLLGTKGKEVTIAPTPTPTEYIFPTDTPAVSETPTEAPTPTGKVSTTPSNASTSSTVDKTTGLDRSNLSIAIENGSGVVGAAGKAADLLKNLGYEIASTGNADSYDYQNVVIEIKPSFSKYMPVLKKDLASTYTIGSTSATLSAGSADAVVIIGK